MDENFNTYEEDKTFEPEETQELTREELNTLEYIDWYIKEFITYFPNIYTPEELKNILLEAVKFIYLIHENDESYDDRVEGSYNSANSTILLTNTNDRHTIFHEFTHALIDYYHPFVEQKNLLQDEESNYNEIWNQTYEVNAIEHRAYEGYVEYICCLYALRKKNNVTNINGFKLNNPKKNHSYLHGASFYGLFNGLYESVYKDSNIIEKGLKGESIFKYIFDIYYKYITCFHHDADDCLDAAYRLSFMTLRYLADFGEFNYFGNISFEEIIDEYTTLEYFIRSILLTFQDNYVISHYDAYKVGFNLSTTKLPNKEDRLMEAIFGDGSDSMNYKKLNNILSDFIINGDEIDGRGSSGK